MITDRIVEALTALLTAVVSLLPSWTPNLPEWSGFGTALGAGFSMLQHYFPVTTLLACLVVLLGARVFLTVWGLLVFLYDRLPFKAT